MRVLNSWRPNRWGDGRRSSRRSPGERHQPQTTATRPIWRAWSWRATAWAVRSDIRRGFWTALPRLPKCRARRAEAGLLEPAGTRTTTRRMGQQREAEAMGWMARNTGPNAPPQRPGKGAAGACVSPCARRGGWGSAGVVLAPAMAPPRSADSVCACVVVPAGSCTTQRPISSALESGPAGVLTRCAVWASPGARYSSIRLGRLAVSISRFCRSSRLQRSRWARAAAVIRGSATRTPLSVSSDDTKLATEPHIEPLGGKPMQLSKTIKVQFKLVESWEKITSQAIRGWHNKSIDQNDILMMNGKWRCLGAQ